MTVRKRVLLALGFGVAVFLAALLCRLLQAPHAVKLAVVFGGAGAATALMGWALWPRMRPAYAHEGVAPLRHGSVGNEQRRRRRNRRSGKRR